MKVAVLGGGLAGISLAYFLQNYSKIDEIVIFEKEDTLGGLCRSFSHQGILVDIGPHIFFSKNKVTLDFMCWLMGDECQRLRRSNRILHKGIFVQYPFENDLGKLPPSDMALCLEQFLHNPYANYPAQNMLQFFLKTFGEGITNLYLRPYNEKIWKFDPAFMDTQMVERIPRPPDEDVIRSAKGETTDGYLHQLYFYYPRKGGTAFFIQSLIKMLHDKVKIHLNERVLNARDGIVETVHGKYTADRIVSCIPPQEITDDEIRPMIEDLKYNGIIIAVVTISVDRAGDNFAFMVADKDVVFHRISKIDFLGESYRQEKTVTYMMEYTYRREDKMSFLPSEALQDIFVKGLLKIGFVESVDEVKAFTLKKFPYAYVIYDLNHKRNMNAIRAYFHQKGILLNGRFGNFEYWNMDRVIAESKQIAERLI